MHQENVSLNEGHLSSSAGNILFANKKYVEVVDLSHPKKLICSDRNINEMSKRKDKLRETPVTMKTEEESQGKSTSKRLFKTTKKGIFNICLRTSYIIYNMISVSVSRETEKEEKKIRETS